MSTRLPGATYRLQMNADFTFADAAALAPYLQALGVSHVYSSPCLKTRTGSTHGYDIIDHNAFNPELGDEQGFRQLSETLHAHGLGLIMDIVPNHMGVGSDNTWWMDVLEHGEASLYADYFDIDWHPQSPSLQNKVLLPFLGDHYGEVLERGELQLRFVAQQGSFEVGYFDQRFPLDPRTFSYILAHWLGELGAGHPAAPHLEELQAIIAHFRAIPRRSQLSRAKKRQRRARSEEGKQRLAALCADSPAAVTWIEEIISRFNGRPGDRASFDQLHRLLEIQAFRLAYWKVAADEINYRRFFDINELAGLRMEDEDVFDATHHLITDLARSGKVDGVRIDHVDGLSDPSAYCLKLHHLLNDSAQQQCYIYLEKILARDEHLALTWPVTGTTGYEFSALINGLYVYPPNRDRLSRLYASFALPEAGSHADLERSARNGRVDFRELLYLSKKYIMQHVLSGELTVLANHLSRIAQADRRTRDFTYNSLRAALVEVVACFPVYRTYITSYHISEEDRRHIRQAIEESSGRNPAHSAIFDFIHRVLVTARQALETISHNPEITGRVTAFCLRFQQYTSMVTAKGLEDTAGYRYQRLVSLNEVGFHPDQFSSTVEEFHAENRRRLQESPLTMLASSTHDSKRSEDVRARINVLSELAEQWEARVLSWQAMNQVHKARLNERPAPSGNDEYLFYQTLVGVWPLQQPGAQERDALHGRVEDYMLKALREAKLETSWTNPNEPYEEALKSFIGAVLAPGHTAFLDDFQSFVQQVAQAGHCASLSQTLLKLSAPGVPDIYQGNELLQFHLVDPDNRRPVDYEQRQQKLQAITRDFSRPADPAALLRSWLQHPETGQAKLFLIWRALQLRRDYPALFAAGDYLELQVQGPRAEHVLAYGRLQEGRLLVVVAPRWFALLPEVLETRQWQQLWEAHWLELPEQLQDLDFINTLTGNKIITLTQGTGNVLPLDRLLEGFPVGLALGS